PPCSRSSARGPSSGRPGTGREARRSSRMPRLAARAVPGSAPAGPSLLDRCAAAVARLAGAPVDPELVLHPAGRAVGRRVLAERRALARDAELERLADPAVDGAELLRRELATRPERIDARVPECLVRIDVP